MKNFLTNIISAENVRYSLRTFGVAFLALFVPGLLGWLNALTEWARAEGATPFPDAKGLAYLAVSAIVAGVIAVVNLLLRALEDLTGKGVLRKVAPRHETTVYGDEHGATDTRVIAIIALVLAVVVLVVILS